MISLQYRKDNKKSNIRRLKGYSLIEIIVSLAIIGIVLGMLSNVLINSIIISQKSLARSFVREEMAEVSNQMVSDIRNASKVLSCTGSLQSAECRILMDQVYIWKMCDIDGTSHICKLDANDDVVFASSGNLTVENFTFEEGFDVGGNTIRRNILVTIVGSHTNDFVNVKNMVQQVSVSTRNYILL